MSALLWIDEKTDDAIDLGNPIYVFTALREIAQLTGDEYPSLMAIPIHLEQDPDLEWLANAAKESINAMSKYGGDLSENAADLLRVIGEYESASV